MDRLIEIVEDEEIIKWKFVDPETKQQYGTEFELRVVPQALQRTLRKKYTKFEFTRSGRVETFDGGKFIDDCLDYAIVGWTGVRRRGEELPCTREIKAKLPEVVKAEIVRLCVGKELGSILAGEEAEGSTEAEGTTEATLPDPTRPVGSGRSSTGGARTKAPSPAASS